MGHQRSGGAGDAVGVLSNLGVPRHGTGLGIQRDRMGVDGFIDEVVAIQDAALIDHVAADDREGLVWNVAVIAPEELAAPGIQGEYNVVRRGDEENSIVIYRNDFVALGQSGRERPDRLQVLGVQRRDLLPRAVSVATVV